MESELKARGFWALARLKGKIWLNAEHLGGCALRAKKFKAKHGFLRSKKGRLGL
ncbi:hypothetical protein RH749_001814 [Campylobacter upsaliensis]|nr:hypothetical protein [Campylobacter upsaliensis]